MKKVFSVVASLILVTGCGALPPDGTLKDEKWANQGLLQADGVMPWKCINGYGETYLRDMQLQLKPQKEMSVDQIKLIDPQGIGLETAYIFPMTMLPNRPAPGLARGWPGEPPDPYFQENQNHLKPGVGQTLKPQTGNNVYSLTLKLKIADPNQKYSYKGVDIDYTAKGKKYTKRFMSGADGWPKSCEGWKSDPQGDKEKYGL